MKLSGTLASSNLLVMGKTDKFELVTPERWCRNPAAVVRPETIRVYHKRAGGIHIEAHSRLGGSHVLNSLWVWSK